MGIGRPRPPAELFELEACEGLWLPSRELAEWAPATFVADGAPILNEDHAHLRSAEIGFLWTNVGNSRHGVSIVGQCEIGRPQAMGKWAKSRAEFQVRQWFGCVPDFIITLEASYAVEVDDVSFCALVEHELYHAGQERDVFGAPKFKRDGSPAFGMRAHDVEEFVGIVDRYGVGAAAGQTRALVEAAGREPSVARASIAHACGTCRA